jgi:hypothetical protein
VTKDKAKHYHHTINEYPLTTLPLRSQNNSHPPSGFKTTTTTTTTTGEAHNGTTTHLFIIIIFIIFTILSTSNQIKSFSNVQYTITLSLSQEPLNIPSYHPSLSITMFSAFFHKNF